MSMTRGSTQESVSTTRRSLPALGTILLIAATFLMANPQAARAATIPVTTTAEELNADADCSLREPLAAANTDTVVDACPAGSGNDIITVPAGTYPIGAQLTVASDLTISGAGAATTILDGGNSDRVLNIGSGTVTVQGVTIRNGRSSGDGGGISNNDTLTVTNSTISGNNAGGNGGGIDSPGTLTITNSTISGNAAFGVGGGIFKDTGGPAAVTNSTISGNNANQGGGIFNDTGGTLTVTNSTISGNTAFGGSGVINASTATITNTIVANNDCLGFTITDGGNNLSFPGATCPGINADPVLGPLQNNGGPTATMALGAGSAAIDAVPAGDPCPATDQRGVFRPQGPRCDIGAFELQPPDLQITKSCTPSIPGTFTCTLVVTNTGDVAATNVVVTDDLSPGLTAGPVTKSDMSFTCVDPPGAVDIRCTSPSLAGGASATFTYTVSIGETAAPGQSFTNNAAVSSSPPDATPANNQAHATITVPGCQRTGTTVTGTPGNDVLCGTAGNDMITGGGGHDLIFLFAGNDKATGGDGNDTILGGPGADELTGGNGNDRLFGNDGNDSLTGGAGTDLGVGGAGADTCNSTESGIC
jgi:uncharacterized repeat protein (TIGR01451 family)